MLKNNEGHSAIISRLKYHNNDVILDKTLVLIQLTWSKQFSNPCFFDRELILF